MRPDGRVIAYTRLSYDIMTDRARPSIWLIDVATGAQTPLVTGGPVDRVQLDGRMTPVAEGLSASGLDRPYTGGQFSVAENGTVAFTSGTRPSQSAAKASAIIAWFDRYRNRSSE